MGCARWWWRALIVAACVLGIVGAHAAWTGPAVAAASSCASADRSVPYWARQRHVTVLLDSVLLSGLPELRSVMSCRRLRARGRPALMVRLAAHQLRASGARVARLTVVGLGYNSLWQRDRQRYGYWARRFDREASRLVRVLRARGARQIVWVTVREPRAQDLTATGRAELGRYAWYFPYVNERLRVLDRRRDDVVLADWAAVSNQRGLTYDSIHLTRKGGILMGRTIKAAIEAEAERQAAARRRAQTRSRRPAA